MLVNLRKFLPFLVIFIIFPITLAQTPSYESAPSLIDYKDKGVVENKVIVSGSDQNTVYKKALISKLPIQDSSSDTWEEASLTPLGEEVGSYSVRGEETGLYYPPRFSIDVSEKESGQYALFLWSCDYNASASTCRWLKPYKFYKPSSSTTGNSDSEISISNPGFIREGDKATLEAVGTGIRNIQEISWTIKRDGEIKHQDNGAETTYVPEKTGEIDSSNMVEITLEVTTDQDTYSKKIEEWIGLSPPSGFLSSPHRGGYHAPENSLMTFKIARDTGANSAEFDIRKTSDDEYVVIHDESTKRTTGKKHKISETPLETLRNLNLGKDYEQEDYYLEVGSERANKAKIPTLGETLDFFKDTDMKLRFELKGEIKKNEDDGKRLYEMVERRNMVDQVIFMSHRGKCDPTTVIGNECSWNALEGVKDESNGEAETAVMWQRHSNPLSVSNPLQSLGQANALPLKYTLNYAEENNMDMIVARDGKNYPVGIKHSNMNRVEFVEAARERDLDYAFMGFRGRGEGTNARRRQQASCGAEWLSTNVPEGLMETVSDWEPEDYRYNREACVVKDKEDGSDLAGQLGGGIWGIGEFTFGSVKGIGEYGWDGLTGIGGWGNEMIKNPSLGTIGDGFDGFVGHVGDGVEGTKDTITDGIGGFGSWSLDTVDSTYSNLQRAKRNPIDWTKDTANGYKDKAESGYDEAADKTCDVTGAINPLC